MRKLLLTLTLLTVCFLIDAQEQPFRSGFLINKKLANNSTNQFFILKEKSDVVEVGYLERTGERILVKTMISDTANRIKKEISGEDPLRGVIKERNGDTLFINFWRFNKDYLKNDNSYVNSNDSAETFILVINKWERSRRGNQIIDIPYRNRQFIAANYPVRVNPVDGRVQSGLENASISYMLVFGKARIYKSDFIEPRCRFWGFGPMLGVGTRTREDDDDKEDITMTGGLSITGSMYGVKLLVALGAERGFNKKSNKITPFIGFGFGIDIYSVVNPEIKRKE